jgi:hypothetical protein
LYLNLDDIIFSWHYLGQERKNFFILAWFLQSLLF